MSVAQGAAGTRAEGCGSDGPASFLRQVFRYGATGALITVVGFGIILVAHQGLGLGITAANLLGYGVGLILSHSLNRRWTFAQDGRPAASAVGRFLGVAGVSFLLNLGVVHGVTAAGFPFAVAQICGVVVYSTVFFLGLKHAAFRA